MEFWGAEVKAGKPLTVKPEEDNLIHISQASLEFKGKKGESVLLFVKVDGKKLVIGTLSQENIPQISFDLVFEKEFELSHNCEKGSVHFIGYKSPNIDDQEEGDYLSDSEEEKEEVPAAVTANGKPAASVSNVVKADAKPKAKPAEVKPESEEEDDEEDESDEDDGSDSEKGMDVDEDDSDDDEDSEEEEEETPKKPEPINKKRAHESASKTPISAKKAKPTAATPQKTGTEDKKKGGHTVTPHPAKKGGKSPVNGNNQSPKSGGQSSAGSNKKPFNSGKQFGSNNKGKSNGNRRA